MRANSITETTGGAARALLPIGGVPAARPNERSRLVSGRAATLLGRGDALLSQAIGAGAPEDRFRSAYLAALRGAGAVLAVADVGGARRSRSRNAWILMAAAAPAFTDWAEYFAGHSETRAAIEAGLSRAPTDIEADEFFREVGHFLDAVEDHIGIGGRTDLRAS